MRSEKPWIVKVIGWVLHIGGNLLKAAFEISTPKRTYSMGLLNDRYERDEIGRSEYRERRAEILRD